MKKFQLIITLKKFSPIAVFLLLCLLPYRLYSQEFTSSSYKVLEPVLNSSNYSTSTSFQLWSNISQLSIGTSSAISFNLNSGFLTYPFVSSPVLSSTAGDGQVSFSWTASDSFLGWTVSGYDIGQSTSSSGPYTYTSTGNVTSYTKTGLSNGTTYYFVVITKDSFGNRIATSSEVSSTPASSSGSGGSGGGGGGSGGGGGGGSFASFTSVNFSGKAYPKSSVTLLKDGQVAGSTVAGLDGSFQINLSNLSGGNYIFSLYSEDNKGIRSSSVTFPVSLAPNSSSNVTGIFIAPTIAVDKSEVRKGDNIAIFGQSAKESSILIQVNSDEEIFVKTSADKDGIYLYNFDTAVLEYGDHTAKSKSSSDQLISSFSNAVGFKVGSKSILIEQKKKCPSKADLNGDCRVNLIDFSIAAYWYKKTLSDTFLLKEKSQLNGDGKITLVDFSIMAFNWTG